MLRGETKWLEERAERKRGDTESILLYVIRERSLMENENITEHRKWMERAVLIIP